MPRSTGLRDVDDLAVRRQNHNLTRADTDHTDAPRSCLSKTTSAPAAILPGCLAPWPPVPSVPPCETRPANSSVRAEIRPGWGFSTQRLRGHRGPQRKAGREGLCVDSRLDDRSEARAWPRGRPCLMQTVRSGAPSSAQTKFRAERRVARCHPPDGEHAEQVRIWYARWMECEDTAEERGRRRKCP